MLMDRTLGRRGISEVPALKGLGGVGLGALVNQDRARGSGAHLRLLPALPWTFQELRVEAAIPKATPIGGTDPSLYFHQYQRVLRV